MPNLRLIAPMLIAVTFYGCGQKPVPAPTAPVATAYLTVTAGEVDDLKPVPATVTSYKMAEATARLAGTLSVLNVKEGDSVRKGQVIGWVQDPRIGPQTGAYAAQAAAAEAQANQARLSYQRAKTLFDKGYYAQAALDQAEAAMKSADANARAAQAQTAASSAYGGQGAIVSPDDGRVIRADVPKGAVVMIGQSVATVTSGAPVVRIEVPEMEGRSLRAGQPVRLEGGGRTATGTVSRVYPSVTLGQVTADVTPAGFENLPVGARVTAYVPLRRRQAVLLPRAYVAVRYGLDYVRLVAPAGVIETTVETAPYDGDHVEVLGGIDAGDRVAPYEHAR